eukprot:8059868-Alexandrium_andersonii.AAC.1
MDSSPIKSELIIPHGAMLAALREIQPNLSFKPGHMSTAFDELSKTLGDRLAGQHLGEWANT